MVSVGSVTVDVVPNVKNFDRELAAQVNPQAKAAGEQAGRNFSDGIQEKVRQSPPRVDMPAPDTKKSDAEIDRFLRDFNARMKREYDQTGQDSGNMLADGLRLSFLRNSPLIAAAVAGGLVAGAPLAVAGAGVLFAGIAAVAEKSNAQLKEAATGAAANIGDVFSTAAQVTVPMFTAALGQVTLAVQQMRPQFQQAFAGLNAPLDSLTTGVVNLVQNAMPGLLAALRNAGPVFAGLASLMGELGTGLGQFFQLVSQHGAAAGQVFSALGQILGAALPILGRLIDVGAQLGAQILPPVAGALRLVADALGLIAPVLPAVVGGLGGLMIARSLQGPLQGLAQTLAFASYNGSAFSGVAGTLSTAAGGLARGLPLLGAALGLVGAAFAQQQQTIDNWAKAILDGSKAAQQFQQQQDNLTHYHLGGKDAVDKYGAALNNAVAWLHGYSGASAQATAEAQKQFDAMGPLAQAHQKVTQAQNEYLAAVQKFGKDSTQAQGYAVGLNDALDNQSRIQSQLDEATKFTDSTVQTFKGALQTTADAASAANSQINLLKGSLDALTGKTVTMDQAEVAVTNATIAATQAVQGKAGALVDATGKLNLHTEAGAAAFTALNNIAGADNQLIATMEHQGFTTDQVRAKDAQLRDSFIQTAEKMGFSAAQAHNLADQIYGIPQQRDVQINTNAADARAAIRSVQEQIDNLHGRDVTINILSASSAGPAAYAVPGSGTGGYATGGVIPGYAPGVDSVPAMLSPGEGVLVPEAVRGLGGAAAIQAINSRFSSRVQRFADGGIVERIIFDPSSFNTGIQSAANRMRDAMLAASAGAGGAAQWAQVALQALAMEGQPASWLGLLLQRMNQESGGNQFAINLWDSNAAAGDPSRGLMQTIGSTFNAYHDPRTSWDIYDPLANIAAAIRYTLARYGSLSAWGQPGGYELGTNWVPHDGYAYLHRGEAVVPAAANAGGGAPWSERTLVVQLDGPATTALLEGHAARVVVDALTTHHTTLAN